MSNDGQTKVVVTKRGQSVGFCGLLFIVLLLLKVGVVETVVIGWSWWWITAPLWGPTALIIGIFVIIVVVIALFFVVSLIIDIAMALCKRHVKKKKHNG